MAGDILKHWQISISILFSMVLVGGAYFIAHTIEAPLVAQASEQTALLQAIASKDSDVDGLPDWEEALYGTDPKMADTFHMGMTDGAAVSAGLIVPKAITDVPNASGSVGSAVVDPSLPPAPADNTLTAQFAQTFFTNFIGAKEANNGADLSETQMNDVASQTLETLTSTIKAAPDFKSLSDLTVSGSGFDAMKTFAASAEAVLLRNSNTATTTDLQYLKNAIINGDESAYGQIAAIAKSYRASAAGIAALPVPKELAVDGLSLINALMRMSGLDTDFTKAANDPLIAILALQQYETVVTAMGNAFLAIGNDYAAAGLSLPAGAPGARFVNMIADIKGDQSALTKP
jgi:hypothetical protein